MKKSILNASLLLFLIAVLMAACASPGAQPPLESIEEATEAPAVPSPEIPTETEAPTPKPVLTEDPQAEDEPEIADTGTPEEAVIADLSKRLKISEDKIEVVSVEAVEWPDGSIGCPLPGFQYTQAVVPGYRIVLQAGGETYTYHTDDVQDRAVLCGEDGMPALPPLLEGEGPTDADPWIPVD